MKVSGVITWISVAQSQTDNEGSWSELTPHSASSPQVQTHTLTDPYTHKHVQTDRQTDTPQCFHPPLKLYLEITELKFTADASPPAVKEAVTSQLTLPPSSDNSTPPTRRLVFLFFRLLFCFFYVITRVCVLLPSSEGGRIILSFTRFSGSFTADASNLSLGRVLETCVQLGRMLSRF